MKTYNFITPSDPITFIADNDKIAFATSLLVGGGKAGCHRYEDGNEINLGTILMFITNVDEVVRESLGMELNEFINIHISEIISALKSFSYGSIEDRKSYDDAIEAITDPEKLNTFKLRHEDRKRSSMSAWVKAAWRYAEILKEKEVQS